MNLQVCSGHGYGQKCDSVPKQNCQQVPKQVAVSNPVRQCSKVPKERCHQVGSSIISYISYNSSYMMSIHYRFLSKCQSRNASTFPSRSAQMFQYRPQWLSMCSSVTRCLLSVE